MIDPELAEVTKRFYRTEAERMALQESLRGEMPPVYLAIRDIVERLHLQGIRFAVFCMKPDSNPPAIHVGMTVCCEKKRSGTLEVTDEMRREVAGRITGRTKYKRVVWEI